MYINMKKSKYLYTIFIFIKSKQSLQLFLRTYGSVIPTRSYLKVWFLDEWYIKLKLNYNKMSLWLINTTKKVINKFINLINF